MKKTMLFLVFLAFIHTQVFADEELGRLLTDFLKGIPGRSALWTETFRPSYGWDAGYPFFSPAIVRIGASEEYDLVQSSLFLLNWDAYTITYFFEALPPDDQLSLEVVPASGVDVTYQLNVPARFPQSEIYDRIHRAERIVREYTRLESMNRGAAVVVFYLGTGLLTRRWACLDGDEWAWLLQQAGSIWAGGPVCGLYSTCPLDGHRLDVL
jgi:hypothetical protein